MGKKCIPGVICIENMTLFLMFIVLILIIYFYYTLIIKTNNSKQDTQYVLLNVPPISNQSLSFAMNTSGLSDAVPPLRIADGAPPHGLRPAVPINIETRGTTMEYRQIGILTQSSNNTNKNHHNKETANNLNNNSPLILPLMGRQSMTGRDKWQYYTMSNSGFVNSKLPVSINGRSCTGEYGCDSIMNGDSVYVEGYDSTFRATVYDTASFQYLPYL